MNEYLSNYAPNIHPKRNKKYEGSLEPRMTKREFLKFCGRSFCTLCAGYLLNLPDISQAQMAKKGLMKARLSPYFTPLGGEEVRCELCPKGCHVPEGERGLCRVRENRKGKLYTLVYGTPCAIHFNPIEMEPFFHVLPGTKSLSLATAGCNFECKSCQNWEIALASPEDVYSYDVSPEDAVSRAKDMRVRSIAYTYAEPIVFYEYMFDTARLANQAGLLNLFHSNGYINTGPLQNLCKVLDAVQIDLKGFTEEFYRDLCEGKLAPVLETMKLLKEEEVHLEITNLMIPSKNDEMSEVREMCLWVKRELGTDVPIHFSRFYPLFRLNRLPPTSVSTLEKARDLALSLGFEYVYIAKVPGHEACNTICPKCKKMIIQRTGYMLGEINLKNGKCGYCGKPIPGIWA